MLTNICSLVRFQPGEFATPPGADLEPSEASQIGFDHIYPYLYFSLPRLPAKSSPTKLNERLFSILLLLEIKSNKGKVLRIGDIAAIGKLSDSDTTRKIKELGKRGLVNKSNIDSDYGTKIVSLSPEGIQVLSVQRQNRK